LTRKAFDQVITTLQGSKILTKVTFMTSIEVRSTVRTKQIVDALSKNKEQLKSLYRSICGSPLKPPSTNSIQKQILFMIGFTSVSYLKWHHGFS